MSVNVNLIPMPDAYRFMSDSEYQAYAWDMFRKLEMLAESDCPPAEWAATVLTAMAAPTPTITLPLEAIEMLIELADKAIHPIADMPKERQVLGEVAYQYMRQAGVWLDLKSVNPPRSVEVSDRVLI